MPEFDPYKLSEDPILAIAYVQSVMLFPDDAEVRREAAIAYACRSLAAEFSSSPSISFEISADMAAFLYAAPRVEDLAGGRGEASVAWLAELAGGALGFILRAAEHGHPKLASRGAVLRGLSRYEKRDLKTLKQAWWQYSCVAHLWASLDLLYEEDQKTLPVFLAAAEELRRRGEAYVPLGAQKQNPVLDPKTTWKVPSSIRLPPVRINLPPPSPADLLLMSRSKHQPGEF